MLTVLLPFKGLAQGKSRWPQNLPHRQRILAELVRQNLATVAQVVGKEQTWLVCPEPWLDEAVNRFPCQAGSLNADLEQARAALAIETPLAVLLPDLPYLQPADVEALVAATRQADVVLCPDRWETGTNALALASPRSLEFAFEGASLAKHRELAQQRGHRVQILSRPGLAWDADREEDLPLPTR